MQSLRDQLLQAGVATKKQKRHIEQEKRHERKRQKKGQFDDAMQAQQQQAYAAKLEAQRATDRQRDALQRAAQEAKETRLQIQHIIDHWKVPEEPAGTHRWCFTTRHKTIKYLYVSDALAAQLDAGALAIVEHPDETDPPYVLLDREAARLIARLDAQYIRFHNTEPADE